MVVKSGSVSVSLEGGSKEEVLDRLDKLHGHRGMAKVLRKDVMFGCYSMPVVPKSLLNSIRNSPATRQLLITTMLELVAGGQP